MNGDYFHAIRLSTFTKIIFLNMNLRLENLVVFIIHRRQL